MKVRAERLEQKMNFSKLVEQIQLINCECTNQASRAVNLSLTLRNWCIGGYIHEYELNGSDRAQYGDRLLLELATNLENISNCNKRQLYRYLRRLLHERFAVDNEGNQTVKQSKFYV